MENGQFTFTATGNVTTPEGREAYNKVMAIKREWDMANQNRLTDSPFKLALQADDKTMDELYGS